MTAVARMQTPIGELTLTATDTALTGVYFPSSRHGPPPVAQGEPHGPAAEILARARQQLAEYFTRARMTFDLPLAAQGTEFEHQVWDALRRIPFGTTTSYGEIARKLGDARNARAVGTANGKNPIPIIVPCHRVIGANGDLTGFGGGIERKRWLLEHEGALLL
ncbi:MAG TPA: methylated-DNA--[protein]-cysteine S-methyltransferase [Gemmatimonadales bacterium]